MEKKNKEPWRTRLNMLPVTGKIRSPHESKSLPVNTNFHSAPLSRWSTGPANVVTSSSSTAGAAAVALSLPCGADTSCGRWGTWSLAPPLKQLTDGDDRWQREKTMHCGTFLKMIQRGKSWVWEVGSEAGLEKKPKPTHTQSCKFTVSKVIFYYFIYWR